MTSPAIPRISLLIKARSALDRRRAAEIIREDLSAGPKTGEFWKDVSQFAAQLGEHGLSIDAARRFAATAPLDMDHVFYYALVLSRNNRLADALKQLDALPAADQDHPAVLHFRATSATQMGEFARAEILLQRALAISPAPVQWLALAVAHKFTPGDPDIARMEAVLARISRAPDAIKAQLLYALGKAYDDIKDMDKAVWAYSTGAALMRAGSEVPDGDAWNAFVAHLIAGYTPENMARLTPSGADGSRMLFVTGFPRSGTTLVEQILTSHSAVVDGSELNLVPVAMMPAGRMDVDANIRYDSQAELSKYLDSGDFTFEDAIAYQQRSTSLDPWGDIGRDYLHMAEERFGKDGRAVDKTLNLGSFMGLLLHSLPNAKVFWLRRRPEDCALSIYRLYSTLGILPWTYSATDIAAFFKAEDQMYAHWSQLFPDRILTVPYESLVSEPADWIRRILVHAGLDEEPQVFEPHKSTRAVTTASMAQVRSPISTSRIGASEAYAAFTEEFRKAYYG